MLWNSRHETAWSLSYEAACRYYKKHGNLNVPCDYVSPDGYTLGRWINMQRTRKKRGKVADKRAKKLGALGMLWSRAEYKKPKSEPIAEEKKEELTPFRYKAQSMNTRIEAV